MATIKEKVDLDYKSAFKERNQVLVDIYRNIKSEILKLEKSGKSATESDVINTLTTLSKQRKESVDAFRSVGKLEQAQSEEFEFNVIKSYLPTTLSNDEILSRVKGIIREGNYTSPKDMGKAISDFKVKYTGQADGKVLSDIVRAELIVVQLGNA